MAEIWAQRSKAVRSQVGCLIVNNRQIISDGYNGMPSGTPQELEVCEFLDADGKLRTKPEVLHAESNAIAKLARHGGGRAAGATLYNTLSPCLPCAKLIMQAGIIRVVYRDLYRDPDGLTFLSSYGVSVQQLKELT